MLKVAAVLWVCAAAWCARAAAAGAAAGGRPDGGNFLDDQQWLTTVSQYDREGGQWNRFRDVSMPPFFRTLDPAKDPCLKMKCSRHKVCIAQDSQTAVCISHRRLTHSFKPQHVNDVQASTCVTIITQCPIGQSKSHCQLNQKVGGGVMDTILVNLCCFSLFSACSDLEFREVANRLRDWFKALHESGSQNKKTKALLRPERSRFDTSILPICKDSLGWMFNRLDTNYDLLLDQSELGSIYLDKNEQCTKAFFNSCDTYKDSLISNNEWCYCFQRQQDPPCQTELSNIQKRQGVKKLLGQYVPLCDEDGYYKPTQCHGSLGQCWCVDRYGNEVMGSRTSGVADCAIDFEISGDFASGDFHEWTDDEDDEDDIMNDEDEIEDDDEDEGDDDDDGDDHDGYI
uniref:SPARC (osteonectin), cwcv and kazal like domains proteoglycan 3 n=1 Tax=Canis lupus dingo TaxID=286419 RepID=A0A8C0JYI4_CANLU